MRFAVLIEHRECYKANRITLTKRKNFNNIFQLGYHLMYFMGDCTYEKKGVLQIV